MTHGNKVYCIGLSRFDGKSEETLGKCHALVTSYNDRFSFVSNIMDVYYFRTNYEAENFRIVGVSIRDIIQVKPGLSHTRGVAGAFMSRMVEVVPEHVDGAMLEHAFTANLSLIVLKYVNIASHSLFVYDVMHESHGGQKVVELPHPSHGTIFGPNCDVFSQNLFYKFTGFTDPGSIFMVTLTPFTVEHDSIGIHLQPLTFGGNLIPGSVSLHDLETRQEFVHTANGTILPIYLFGRTKQKGPRPTILYVHEGFGNFLMPTFSSAFLAFVRHYNGLICMANIRGGGEFGADWRDYGRSSKRLTAVEDVIDIAEYLMMNDYTKQSSLALLGGSGAGVTIGACMNFCPFHFGAVVVENGLFDLVEYPSFSPFPDPTKSKEVSDEGPAGGTRTSATSSNASINASNPIPLDPGLSIRYPPAAQCPDKAVLANCRWFQEFGLAKNAQMVDVPQPETREVPATLSPVHGIADKEFPYPAVLLWATWSDQVCKSFFEYLVRWAWTSM
jgi:prolyl oligopeptidase